jgi:hypothetical protein
MAQPQGIFRAVAGNFFRPAGNLSDPSPSRLFAVFTINDWRNNVDAGRCAVKSCPSASRSDHQYPAPPVRRLPRDSGCQHPDPRAREKTPAPAPAGSCATGADFAFGRLKHHLCMSLKPSLGGDRRRRSIHNLQGGSDATGSRNRRGWRRRHLGRGVPEGTRSVWRLRTRRVPTGRPRVRRTLFIIAVLSTSTPAVAATDQVLRAEYCMPIVEATLAEDRQNEPIRAHAAQAMIEQYQSLVRQRRLTDHEQEGLTSAREAATEVATGRLSRLDRALMSRLERLRGKTRVRSLGSS